MDNMIQLKENFELITRSTEQYPVDFDQAWQWVGYARKDVALDALKNNFEEKLDFCSGLNRSKEGRGGHNQILYFLTVDCFKAFCMMAGTEKGKEVRKYYLRIEKEYFETLAPKPALTFLDGGKRIENLLNSFGFNVRFVRVDAVDAVDTAKRGRAKNR